MSGSHSHVSGHSHAIPGTTNERALGIALALTGTLLVAEVVAGIVFSSLALLSDAAHMFTAIPSCAASRCGATPYCKWP